MIFFNMNIIKLIKTNSFIYKLSDCSNLVAKFNFPSFNIFTQYSDGLFLYLLVRSQITKTGLYLVHSTQPKLTVILTLKNQILKYFSGFL
jgi:hypothetical protein